ncbi:DEAD/DEAH box helicase [Candidatus Woesearchaeota archaeon]|nr:DEAD/DEAH box helicase [Candidatus Woesearchaeota archaeon]
MAQTKSVVKYRDFVLDQFQIDSIKSIDAGHSVVVSAATGTGKTLIADYLIDRYIKKKKRIIYTAPIKALSNQKYKEFKTLYGEEKVGILTGDVTINHDAQILIMTTEIYRNMLLSKDSDLDALGYVVYDEIHFISDIERGTVWEESIIFSPEHVRFLCLSATIPNARQFADWISTIKNHIVDVVEYSKRAVPLTHHVYDYYLGLTTIKELKKELSRTPNYYDVMPYAKKKKNRGKRREKTPFPSHLDVIEYLSEHNQLPCFFFAFSRKKCEELAEQLGIKHDFTNAAQKKEILDYYYKTVSEEVKKMDSARFLKNVLVKGVAVHHAGILPKLKEVVEELFARGLISVLYTTETFAVGINMPAKTVCFNSLEKFDGFNFRYLNSKEYFQLAGRAGRRGIDKEGRAIALVDRNRNDLDKITGFTSKDTEPIISQFHLTYNTVLNIVHNHTPDEREKILKMNFDYFLKRQTSSNKQVRIMSSYKHKYKTLEKMGYLRNDELTSKGLFAKHIYSEELILTEIFTSDLYKKLSDNQLLILLGAIAYEEKKFDKFKFGDKKDYFAIIDELSKHSYLDKALNKMKIARMNKIVSVWANGCDFEELLDYTSYVEGDIIRLFRQIIDRLHQVIRAGKNDYELVDRLHLCAKKIQRDVIKVEF